MTTYFVILEIPRAGNAGAARARLSGNDLAALLVDRAAFHHELHVLKHAHVGERIAVDGDDVGEAAWPDAADVLLVADEIGGGTGGRDDRVHRLHARAHHEREF